QPRLCVVIPHPPDQGPESASRGHAVLRAEGITDIVQRMFEFRTGILARISSGLFAAALALGPSLVAARAAVPVRSNDCKSRCERTLAQPGGEGDAKPTKPSTPPERKRQRPEPTSFLCAADGRKSQSSESTTARLCTSGRPWELR